MTNIRRARGYNFENKLVKELDGYGWHARRLGGSSTGLPDIVATFNIESRLFSIEAKNTGVSNYLYVPQDEYERCRLILNMFDIYKEKNIVLAFRFGPDQTKEIKYDKKGNPKTKRTRKETRLYFFKITSDSNMFNLAWIRCYIDGSLSLMPKDGASIHPPGFTYFKYDSVINLIKGLHLKN